MKNRAKILNKRTNSTPAINPQLLPCVQMRFCLRFEKMTHVTAEFVRIIPFSADADHLKLLDFDFSEQK